MKDIISEIRKSRRAAVIAHINEDPDAMGSCMAMCCVLRAIGNDPICYMSDEVESEMKFIGGEYTVYDGTDAGDHDLCICLDCGDISRLGERVAIFEKCPVTINIDHHYTNDNFADYNYVDGKATATGEILYRLFTQMGAEITRETARYLYIAISADTGGFKYPSASPETLRIAASLMETGIDHAELSRLLYDTESIAEIRLKGYLMSNIHSYCDGKLNIVRIDDALLERFGAEGGGSDFVNIPRRVAGTEVAACIKHTKGRMKISLRSNGKINVAETALRFGGGGHVMAAGATLDTDDMQEAEKIVVWACSEEIKKQLGRQ